MHAAIVSQLARRGDGQGRINYEIATEATRRGHRLTLLASELDNELQANELVRWIHISSRGWPTQLIRDQVFARRAETWLRIHRRDIDVLHVNGCVASVAADVNAVHFVHHAWLQSSAHTARVRKGPYGLYQLLYSRLNARWERSVLNRASVVVAVSERVREQVEAIGIPRKRIRVIPNGVDIDQFTPRMNGRRSIPTNSNRVVALFVGDIRSPIKNLDSVLHALAPVRDVDLVVVGETRRSPYPAMAERLGMSDRVRFLGFRKDVSEVMASADFLVFPSRYESFSLVLLEAMASGLPVVTAKTVGAADLVTPSCGYVLDEPDDVTGLRSFILALSTDPQRRRYMGAHAREHARRYSSQIMARKYVDLFEEIHSLNGNGGAE